MGAKCWTYPLKILKGIPKNRPMFLKNSDEFGWLLISKLVTYGNRSFGVTIRGLSSTRGHASTSSLGRFMVSPKSSFSSMKSLASFSKADLGDSKGKTDMTSLGSCGLGRDSTIEFLAQVIGMEKVSLPSFTSKSLDDGGLRNFSRGHPIMTLKSLMSKTWKSREISVSPWYKDMS